MKRVYIIAIIVALLVAVSVYFFASSISDSVIEEKKNKIEVVLAAADIPKDTIITKEMLVISEVPKDVVSVNSCRSIDELVDKIAVNNIYTGDQINVKDAITVGNKEEENSKLSYKLKSGEYAITIPIAMQSSVGYYVESGDFVNILYYATNEKKPTRIYEDMRVIAVGDKSENAAANGGKLNSYGSVTLVVTAEQSMDLAEKVKSGSFAVELPAYVDSENAKKEAEAKKAEEASKAAAEASKAANEQTTAANQ